MAFNIYYKKSVIRDLKNLDKNETVRIINKIEKELKQNPEKGEQLKGKFAGLLRLRVGDSRVIYAETKDGVLILLIAHRKEVYKKLDRGNF